MILKVVLVYFNRLCGGLLMIVVVVVVVFFFFFGGWVVVATMVVVVADGGCFGFFAMGWGYHDGASGGSNLWVFGGPVWV